MSVNYDQLTAERMAGTLGAKWTMYPDCIGAFVAEMDYGTAPVVKEAVAKAVDAGYFGYLPKYLDAELAEATANWYHRHTDWSVTPQMVHSMPDVLTGLSIALTHYAPKGGKVVLPTPAYMPFLFIPGIMGREIIQVPMHETDNGWEYDYEGIEQAFRDGGEVLVVCNPYNPIGKVSSREEMEKLGEIVARYDGRVFSDEIHAPLLFRGQKHIPYASINEVNAGHTVTAIAASKAWNLPGLKCAQLVISNDADATQFEKSGAMWMAHGASVLGVIATTTAYNEGQPWLDDVLSYLEGNRDALEDLVARHLPGVTYRKPDGTYLAWLDFSETNAPDELDTFFREEAKVAITPGSACGEAGTRKVRFNFAMSRPLLEETIERMGKALSAIPV
jgi:cystathionine beta-lyase